MSERVKLEAEDAMARLVVTPDYDPGGEGGPGPCVHSVRDSGTALCGAYWRLLDVQRLMLAFGAYESGPRAQADGYGVVVNDEVGPVFFKAGMADVHEHPLGRRG